VRQEWADAHGLPSFAPGAEFGASLDAVCERLGVQTEVERRGSNRAVFDALEAAGESGSLRSTANQHGVPQAAGPATCCTTDACCATEAHYSIGHNLGYHSVCPWSARKLQPSGPAAQLKACVRGVQPAGCSPQDLPRNCSSTACSSYCTLGCRSGHKQSSDLTWLVNCCMLLLLTRPDLTSPGW